MRTLQCLLVPVLCALSSAHADASNQKKPVASLESSAPSDKDLVDVSLTRIHENQFVLSVENIGLEKSMLSLFVVSLSNTVPKATFNKQRIFRSLGLDELLPAHPIARGQKIEKTIRFDDFGFDYVESGYYAVCAEFLQTRPEWLEISYCSEPIFVKSNGLPYRKSGLLRPRIGIAETSEPLMEIENKSADPLHVLCTLEAFFHVGWHPFQMGTDFDSGKYGRPVKQVLPGETGRLSLEDCYPGFLFRRHSFDGQKGGKASELIVRLSLSSRRSAKSQSGGILKNPEYEETSEPFTLVFFGSEK